MRPTTLLLAFGSLPFLLSTAATAQSLRAEFFGEPFGRLTDIASAPGDFGRLFTTEKTGKVKILSIPGGNLLGTFLDIGPMVDQDGEGGLLGLAFHPDYLNNGLFYVAYTTGMNQGDSIVSQFTVSAADPNSADVASEQVIWGPLPQTTSGHKAGDLEFGPDGMLYFSIGDGEAGGGDPSGRAQNPLDPRGKILRFDVDAPFPHVPVDNPFVGDPNGLDHIWALGFRNPFRMSVDPLTGDIYVGDVGQSTKEEVNFIPGGVGGLNFGWNCQEGTGCFGGCGQCGSPAFTDPIYEYDNGPSACAVIGGVIYRGSAIPDLVGRYMFTDLCTEEIRTFREVGGVATDVVLHTGVAPSMGQWNSLAAFGRDAAGEIYVLNHFSGEVFRIVSDCTPSVQNHCQTAANSVGPGALLSASGSTSISAANFQLRVVAASPGVSGLFYYGANAIEVPFGDGFRCVGGSTFRILPIAQTDASGNVNRDLNYNQPQTTSITPGSTWSFQFWYRDPMGPGGSGFNLTDGVTASFCP